MANPDLAPAPYPETPVKTPPTIYIHSPKENTTYPDDTLNYTITIEKPASWFDNQTLLCIIKEINCTIDEETHVSLANYQLTPELNYQTENITINGKLPKLPSGEHTLAVEVYFVGLYHPTDIPHDFYGWWATVAEEPNFTVSETMQFTVTNDLTTNALSTVLLAIAACLSILIVTLFYSYSKRNSKQC
ncbi:MAG: hypothetical protein ACFCUE_12125 [Candidatus Bathyarchaeia archaeon]